MAKLVADPAKIVKYLTRNGAYCLHCGIGGGFHYPDGIALQQSSKNPKFVSRRVVCRACDHAWTEDWRIHNQLPFRNPHNQPDMELHYEDPHKEYPYNDSCYWDAVVEDWRKLGADPIAYQERLKASVTEESNEC